MKIAIINDIHASDQKRSTRVVVDQPLKNLGPTIQRIRSHNPDKIIFLGDLIHNVDTDHDTKLLNQVLDIIKPVKNISFIASGNHEGRGLGLDYLSSALSEHGFDHNLYGSFETHDQTLIYLSTTESRKNGTRSDFLPQEQLDWLSETLEETHTPIMIFSHHALFQTPHTHNFYIENVGVDNSAIKNANDLEPILIKHQDKIKLSVCAHSHWLNYNQNTPLPMLGLPAYSENLVSDISEDIHPQAWSLIDWQDDTIKVNSFSGLYSMGQIVI